MHIFSVHAVKTEEISPAESEPHVQPARAWFRGQYAARFYARMVSKDEQSEYRVYLDRQLVAIFRGGKDCSPAGAS